MADYYYHRPWSGRRGFHHGGQSDEERATWIVSNRAFNEIASQTPGIVDIFPTIASYMEMTIPKNQAMEVDGVSLLGEAYASNLTGSLSGTELQLNWKSYGSGALGRVWVTSTNQFRYGNTDLYRLMGEVKLDQESAAFDLKTAPNNLKVVLELPAGFINVWVKNTD